jgi:hypothetical protein
MEAQKIGTRDRFYETPISAKKFSGKFFLKKQIKFHIKIEGKKLLTSKGRTSRLYIMAHKSNEIKY